MKKVLLTALFMLVAIGASYAQNRPDDILGVYWNEEKDGRIEIYKCGNTYCGKLIWIKDPTNADGSPKLDVENPEEKLRSRKLQGLELLFDLEWDASDNEWDDGEIYDPKSGNTYSCYIYFDEDDPKILRLRGYIGASWMGLGRTSYWTRYQ